MIRENGVPPSAAHGFDVYFEVSYIKGQVEIGLKSQAGLVLFTVDLTGWWGVVPPPDPSLNAKISPPPVRTGLSTLLLP